jgi:hypothetical protein
VAAPGEQWHVAPIHTLPSGISETHLDVGTNVRPANIIADYHVLRVYLSYGQLPAVVTLNQRRSNVFELYSYDNEMSNNIVIVD